MTSLSEILSGQPLRPRPGRLNPPKVLAEAAGRIFERWGNISAPAEKEQEAILRNIAQRVEHWNWADATLREAKAAARAAFLPEWIGDPRFDGVRRFFIKELPESELSLRDALFDSYLDGFAPSEKWIEELSEALSKSSFTPRVARLAVDLPALFDLGKVSGDIAKLMDDDEGPAIALNTINMPRPRATGLMRHAHLSYVQQIAPRLAERPVIDQLLDWLEGPNNTPLQSGAAEAITALIAPWVRIGADGDISSHLTRRLVALYRDPRLHTGDPWRSVGNEERALFERWLTGENLRLLFDAVSMAAQSSDEKRMWRDRRQFYLGLHNAGRIDSAWVAFADDGARYARSILARTGGPATMQFGKQVDRGARINTSIMILKIGRKIVVDGSHSYKVHVFDQSAKDAPVLYRTRYSCEDIRNARSGPESRPHLGDWQNWVMQRL